MRFLHNPDDLLSLAGAFSDLVPPPDAAPGLLTATATDGSTVATGIVTSVATTGATAASHPIATATGAVITAENQSVGLTSLFNVTAATTDPAYLILSVLDRDEYTAGYSSAAMGDVTGGGKADGFGDFNGDGYSIGVVFTYNASTGQYTNSTYGTLSQMAFKTGTDLGDTATISLFATSNASLATSYATNPYVMAENPSYFTDEGSVAVVTAKAAATPPSAATPGSIVSAALTFVGDAWNMDGCWVLASNIAAKAGTTLPVTSTLVGVAGTSNGEWIVAYNGPVASNTNWEASLLPGEIVSFVTTSGGGHITTVVSGSGANAQLVDNITYENANGSIANLANDGSPNDIIVSAPHAAAQEFTGVNAKYVVVYELDTPIVTTKVTNPSIGVNGKLSLAADFAASNPVATQTVTQYQVYDTLGTDSLTLSGVAQSGGHSAATAISLTSIANLGLAAGATAATDTVEVRAYNGLYWGDWTALAVTITPGLTVAQALATAGSAPLSIADTAANIAASANQLQTLAAAGRIDSLSLTSGTTLNLTAAQFTSDKTLLALLPGTATLAVSGATVAQAATLQSNAQVRSFTITDTIADMKAQTTALAKDTKLAGYTVSGTTAGGTLSLLGFTELGTVALTGNHASVSAGLGAASISFLTAPDALTLGSGAVQIDATLNAVGGVDTITNFAFGVDELILNLAGAASSTLHAANTTVGGQHAISLYGTDATHGIVLLGEPASMTANLLLASHTSFSNGAAIIT